MVDRSILLPVESRERTPGPDACLTPALAALLTACCELGTDDPLQLARHLHLSLDTVRSNFKRINARLGTSSRAEAILYALRRGWIALGSSDSPVAPTAQERTTFRRVMKRMCAKMPLNWGNGNRLFSGISDVHSSHSQPSHSQHNYHSRGDVTGGVKRRKLSQRDRGDSSMKLDERDDFVDLVAQAVIDRIEERDRIQGLVEMVVARVLHLQKEAKEAVQAAEPIAEPTVDVNTSPGAARAPDSDEEE